MPQPHGFARSAEPNVTPMIDVLLVLLIIFMAAIPSARHTVDAQLPSEEVAPGTAAVPIVLEVMAGGRYAVNRLHKRRGVTINDLS